MNNFNFVHHPHQTTTINLDEVLFFKKMAEHQHDMPPSYAVYFTFKAEKVRVWWEWFEIEAGFERSSHIADPRFVAYPEEKRDNAFNALLKLTSQNLYTEESPTADPPQTCPTTPKQNIEKRPPHLDSNPF